MQATPLQVGSFLGKLQRLAPKDIKLIRQEKTVTFMRSIYWNKPEVDELLQSLTVADYSQGPMLNDWGNGGQVWVFGPMVEDQRAYLKLSHTPNPAGPLMLCLSLHRPEYRMPLPYANRK